MKKFSWNDTYEMFIILLIPKWSNWVVVDDCWSQKTQYDGYTTFNGMKSIHHTHKLVAICQL